jgi:hypothetical protein
MDTKDTKRRTVFGLLVKGFLCVLGVLCVDSALVWAQPGGFAMPDPKEMSGIPRPVDDLPNSVVSVRLIRGSLSNNIAGHPVELHIGSKVVTVKTDESGRAQFGDLAAGMKVRASADVDGEHLDSQEFPVPARGGIRLMLVATDPNKKPSPTPAPGAPAQTGPVVIGDQSRIVMQPREEGVEVFYLLDIANTQSVPVNPPTPFVIEMPTGATGTAIMDGSSPQASVKGLTVTVAGPFQPGHTFVQVATSLPAEDGAIDIAQRLPADLSQLAVIVKKLGETTLKSPQLKEQREMPADGEVFIAATGGPVRAGQPIQITVDGVPHHSQAPRRVALTLSTIVVLVGVWFATRSTGDAATLAAAGKRLVARREKLLNELARLEQDRRSGRADDRRSAARREELVTSLEQIYSELDSQDVGPGRVDGVGLAPRVDGLRAS